MGRIRLNARHAIYRGSDIDPYYDKCCDRCVVRKIGGSFANKHLDIVTAKTAKAMFGSPCVICEDCRHINKLRTLPRQIQSKIKL
jgi:hypothetical protein